jgi:hypothetical protein
MQHSSVTYARSVYPVAIAFVFALTTTAVAQHPTPQEAAPAPAPVQNAAPSGAPTPPPSVPASPVEAVRFPSTITVELRGEKNTALGFSTWATIIVALITAAGSVAVATLTLRKNQELQTQLQRDRQRHETLLDATKGARENRNEDRRLTQARTELQERTNASALEIEQAAWKIVHDQKIEESKLIHMFFERLVSKNPKEQKLALLAISEFVDPSVIEVLASAGEEIVSRENLSRLASGGGSNAASVAQEILNRDWASTRESIVQISTDHSECNKIATVFFISPNLIVTVSLTDVGKEIHLSGGHGQGRRKARCKAIDQAHFIMIAEVEADAARPSFMRMFDDERKGSAVRPLMLRSHGIDSDENATLVQRSNDGALVVRSARVSAEAVALDCAGPDDSMHSLRDFFEVEVLSEPGAGGAPLFDEKGLIMGVLVVGATVSGPARSPAIRVSYAANSIAVQELLASSKQLLSQ